MNSASALLNVVSAFLHAFHFLRPLWLAAIPVLWGLVYWRARRHRQAQDWSRVIDPQLMAALRLDSSGGGRQRDRQAWPWLALAWTLAAVALAGPTWQRIASEAYRAPAAWAVVLDLSPSMASADLAPNRITRARYVLDDILASARDARVGLVVFGEEPFVVTPLTEDVATVRALLPPLVPDIMPNAGDHLAPALEQAAQLLKQVSAKDRRLIVLTDGFDDPAAAMTAAKAIRAQGIDLSVVGIGTPGGAPLRDAQGNFSPDNKGYARMARLDVDRLRQLASIGGGRYVDMGQVPALTAGFQSVQSAQASGGTRAASGIEIAHWQDGGVWLLPLLLILVAVLSRKGWL